MAGVAFLEKVIFRKSSTQIPLNLRYGLLIWLQSTQTLKLGLAPVIFFENGCNNGILISSWSLLHQPTLNLSQEDVAGKPSDSILARERKSGILVAVTLELLANPSHLFRFLLGHLAWLPESSSQYLISLGIDLFL